MLFKFVVCLFAIFLTVDSEMIVLHTTEEKQYNFFPLNDGQIEFSVNATRDVYVAFTEYPSTDIMYYEVALGVDSNTRSEIRIYAFPYATYNAPTLDPKGGFQTFWARVDNVEGSISVGRKNKREFMKVIDEDFMEMRYFGLSTGLGEKGVFHFDNVAVECGTKLPQNTYYNVILQGDSGNSTGNGDE